MNAHDAVEAILLATNNEENGLATLCSEAGDLRADIFEARARTYRDAIDGGSTVTDARNHSDLAVVNLQKQLHVIEGDIEAQRARVEALRDNLNYLLYKRETE